MSHWVALLSQTLNAHKSCYRLHNVGEKQQYANVTFLEKLGRNMIF